MYTNKELDKLQKQAKERTVKTQPIEYDLETIVKKIQKGYIKLNPDYQRNHRWDEGTSSRLIESLILNIPIPIIYLSLDVDIDVDVEDDNIPRYTVIDGQQRLTAILQFLSNELELTELDILKNLQDKKYEDLPGFLVRRLEERTVSCLRIDSTVDKQVKYDIFERLNTGSVQLSPQEIRNAIVRGPFNDLIKELSKDVNFRKLVQIKYDGHPKVKKMEDVELVLRFFALTGDRYLKYKGGFKDFLTESMKDLNMQNTAKLNKMNNHFRNTMKLVLDCFGELAFAKYKIVDGDFVVASKFNTSVYDALVIAVDALGGIEIIPEEKVDAFRELFRNDDFFHAITGSVTDAKKLRTRADMSIKVLSE